MSCTTAVFTLMMGAIGLSCTALYFHFKNITEELKLKINTFNTALSNLQGERHNLMAKSDNMYLENASQTVENERLSEEITLLKSSLERLETDNRLILREYKKIEYSAYKAREQYNSFEV